MELSPGQPAVLPSGRQGESFAESATWLDPGMGGWALGEGRVDRYVHFGRSIGLENGSSRSPDRRHRTQRHERS